MMAASLINISHGLRQFTKSKRGKDAAAAAKPQEKASFIAANEAVEATAQRRTALKTVHTTADRQPHTPRHRVDVGASQGIARSAARGERSHVTTPSAAALSPRAAMSAPANVRTKSNERHHPAATRFESPTLPAGKTAAHAGRGRGATPTASPAKNQMTAAELESVSCQL